MPNLYTLFDNGTFESGAMNLSFRKADESSPQLGPVTISTNQAYEGVRSGRVGLTTAGMFGGPSAGKYGHIIPYLRCKPGQGPNAISLTVGQKYRAKCRVYVPSATKISNNTAFIMLGGLSISGLQTGAIAITTPVAGKRKLAYNGAGTNGASGFIETTGVFVGNALDQWVELEYIWIEQASNIGTQNITISVELYKVNENGSNPAATLDLTVGGTVNNDILAAKEFYFDALTIEPVISCDLAYGAPSYTKTDESGAGLNNGTVTINATSSFAIQYRLDGGAWQLPNVFTGVPPGIHTVDVQDLNGCVLPQITNINILAYVPPACDVVIQNVIVTNETGVGLNDGTATISATSADALEYAVDAGAYQPGTLFIGIAPGNHTARVRKVGGACPTSQPFVVAAFLAPPVAAPLVIDLRPVNDYNFVTWYNTSGKINFSSTQFTNCIQGLPKAHRLNKVHGKHYPVIINDEQFTFYINFSSNYNYPGFASLRLDLVNEYGLVEQSVAVLNRVYQDDNINYFIYASVILSNKARGLYRLVITDTSTVAPYNVLFATQQIQLMTATDAAKVTARFRYRASASIYRYLYTKLSLEFLLEIRLRVNCLEDNITGDIDTYRAVTTGIQRDVAADLDKEIVLESYWFDDLANAAMGVWQIHDYRVINNLTYALKELYKVQWDRERNLNIGTITLYEQAFSSANRFGDPNAITVSDPVLGSDDGNVIGV